MKLTPEELVILVRKHGLETYESALLQALKPTIRIERTLVRDESEIPVGASKLGGSPDVPPGFQWKSWHGIPLTFIAQFRLSDVTSYDREGLLPKQGMLYCFYEAQFVPDDEHPQNADRGMTYVWYYPDATGGLERKTHPLESNIQEMPRRISEQFGYPYGVSESRAQNRPLHPCRISFEAAHSLPSPMGMILLPELYDAKEAKRKSEGLWTLYREITLPKPMHQLLGAPGAIQNPMEETCERVLNRWYPGETASQDVPQLEERAKDWRLLLQMDYDVELGLVVGDMGRLFLWIRKQDLAACDFSDVVTITESY